MQQYEIAVLYDPGLEVDLTKAEDRVKKIFTDNGGKVTATDNWGKRKLAYPINKNDHAVYVFYAVDITPETVGKIEGLLNIADEVIRYLIVKVDHKGLARAAEAKAVKAKRQARSEEKPADVEAKEEE